MEMCSSLHTNWPDIKNYRLAALLDHPVKSLPEIIGAAVESEISRMAPGDVVLLENLRFDSGEEKNEPDFARSLARLADLFVMDAFAVAHRAHASTVGVTEHLPSVMGFLVGKEVNALGRALEAPEKPLAALMGGAKVSDKILVLENLLGKLDHLFIGGGMCVTFLNALGYNTGSSRVEDDRLDFAKEIVERAKSHGIAVHLPDDLVVASEFGPEPSRVETVEAGRGAGRIVHHGHRPQQRPAIRPGIERLQNDNLERSYGRVRNASLQRRHAHRCHGHRWADRGDHRGGGRLHGGGCRGTRPDGAYDTCIHGRRRFIGIPGGTGAAGDCGPAGRVV